MVSADYGGLSLALSSPPSQLRPLTIQTTTTTLVKESSEKESTGASLSAGVWLLTSFCRNFLAYQVQTLHLLACLSTSHLKSTACLSPDCRIVEESMNCNVTRAENYNSNTHCGACNFEASASMMINRQVRGLDGFVSRSSVRPTGLAATRSRGNTMDAIMFEQHQRFRAAHHYQARTFDYSDQQAASLMEAAAAMHNQMGETSNSGNMQLYQLMRNECRCRSPPGARYTDPHRSSWSSARSNTFESHNEHPKFITDYEHDGHTRERFQNIGTPRQPLDARLPALPPDVQPRAHSATPFSERPVTLISNSLPSSRRTIPEDEANSCSNNSLDYSVDEPISLPANINPSSVSSPLPHKTHQALARASTQLIAHYRSKTSATGMLSSPRSPRVNGQTPARNAALITRPSSGLDQRTLHQHHLNQQERRSRQVSVEDFYAKPLTLATRQPQNRAKSSSVRGKIGDNKPMTIGSDSELYHQPKSILQSSNRAYYIHTSIDRTTTGASSVASGQTSAARLSTVTCATSGGATCGCIESTASMTSKTSQLSVQQNNQATRKNTITKKLSLAGAKRRLGFKQSGLSALSVQRSEEVLPLETSCKHLMMSCQTTGANSLSDSGTESSSCWLSQNAPPSHHYHQQTVSPQHQQLPAPPPDPRSCFVEGLGAGQIASRQALVSPYLGDIQLALNDRRGMLEVDVIRARSLQVKAGAETLPSPYVKVYLMRERKCIAKCKTSTVRRTLDPLYQQKFIFREEYVNCVLQVIVWGDYGKKDRKSLMGIVQIHLDDLDISDLVIGWYKLFNVPSMTNSSLSSKALRHLIMTKNLTQQHQQQPRQQFTSEPGVD